jgi:isopentenyl phosphate kinase
MPGMKLQAALKHAGRFSFQPKYSLFHCDAKGNYDWLLTTFNADEIVLQFKQTALKPETVGLEIRCDGVSVKFDGVE